MKELLQRHGFLGGMTAIAASPTIIESIQADSKRSKSGTDSAFTFSLGDKPGKSFLKRRLERDSEMLKKLSESALPARAIMLIRNGVSGLQWGIQPNYTVPLTEHKEFVEEVTEIRRILENPNPEDDDFYTFLGQIVEDLLCFDAGVWEYVERPDFMDNNNVLALYPVPGHTIAKRLTWKGDPNDVRWIQTIGKQPQFLDKDLEYSLLRKRSFSPFGYSPLEVAVDVMDAWLGLSSYQRNVASNAYPRVMLYLGEDVSQDQAKIMRSYWQMELEGKGRPGIWGNTGQPKVLDLKPSTDQGLYITYQEMLVRTLAYSFGLKPQDFGLERDVNRSTSIVSQVASIEEGRRPIARLLASKINARVIPRIAKILNNEKMKKLEFFWIGIDPRQQKIDSEINDIYLKHDVKAIDDVRKEIDLPPLPGGLGQFPPSVIASVSKTRPELIIKILRGEEITDTDVSGVEPDIQDDDVDQQLAASLEGILTSE